MKKIELTREQMADVHDLHTLFSSELGRRVLARWHHEFNLRRSYVDGDPHATSFREGQRDFYLQILDAIELATHPERVLVVEGAPEEDA